MKIEVINKRIAELKKRYGKLLTNIYKTEDKEASAFYETEEGILYEVTEPEKIKVYYAVKDKLVFLELIQNANKGAVLEYIHRKGNDLPIFLDTPKLKLYKTYIRITVSYKSNPFELPEEGRRALLPKMYDPTCGEYPDMSDIDELDKLMRENFDVLTDYIFTREQWEEIIKRKECLCYKENGVIYTFYIWRLEGKKLYINVALNMSTANYLYNLERRVFEEMWAKGIRTSYAWYHVKNYKALKRQNKKVNDVVLRKSELYNTIYLVQ